MVGRTSQWAIAGSPLVGDDVASGRQDQAGVFGRSQFASKDVVRNLQRVRPGREVLEQFAERQVAVPRQRTRRTGGVDHALYGRGRLGGCVAELDETEPLRWQCSQLVDRRVGPEEMKRVDQDSGVGPIDGLSPPPPPPADRRFRTMMGTRGPPSVRSRVRDRRDDRTARWLGLDRGRSAARECAGRRSRQRLRALRGSCSGSSSGPSRASSTSSTWRPVSARRFETRRTMSGSPARGVTCSPSATDVIRMLT